MKTWTRLLKRWLHPEGIDMTQRRRRPRPRLVLEQLETRLAPATLTVNSLADNTADTSALTLRDAITLVNNAGNPASLGQSSMPAGWASQIDTTNPFGNNDMIQFDANLAGQTITLGSALPALTSNVAIVGLGATNLSVSGAGQYQVLAINTGVTASISGLTIENGLGGNSGGAIANTGTVTISSSTFAGNSASVGGAIANGGTLMVSSSTFTDNSATVAYGGGIDNEYGRVTVSNSTFSSNSATFAGGAIWSDAGAGLGGSLTVNSSSFDDNSATVGGGGIAVNGGGNWTYNNQVVGPTVATVNGCTIVGNDGGGIGVSGAAPTPPISMDNDIVAGNTDAPDISGAVLSSSGYNLIGDGSGMTILGRYESGVTGLVNGSNGNLVGTAANPINPLLAPLGDYGGPTQTMALLPGSPALDAGDPNQAGSTDQRGVTRPSVRQRRYRCRRG